DRSAEPRCGGLRSPEPVIRYWAGGSSCRPILSDSKHRFVAALAAGAGGERVSMSLIRYLTKIHFAENVLEDAIEAELGLLDMTRPLIVSDNCASPRGLVDRLLAALPRGATPTLFEASPGRPGEKDSARGARLFHEQAADGLIAFGGAA